MLIKKATDQIKATGTDSDFWEEVELLSKIDSILFSEVMRDIDLVVSAAYTGEVDPEASVSSVARQDTKRGLI